MAGFPVLSVIVFLPLLGAVGATVLPRMVAWGWALACALADLGLVLWLVTQFDPQSQGLQFAEAQQWIPGFGINYTMGVDGISLWLIGLNALLAVVAIGASWSLVRTTNHPRQYTAFMLLLVTGMQGVFLATNLFLFYVFWELMLVPAYLLVGMFGGERRAYAAIKFVIYTAVGSLLMLVSIIATGAVVSVATQQPYTLDYAPLLFAHVPAGAQIWLFLAFAAAFAVKAGVFPLHSWVPDAYSEAPVPVVVLIAGVMAKTGVYGFIRFAIPLFPQAAHTLAPLMEWLAVIGILYFAIQALVQTDFKRLLGYVSISHMSVIVLGLFALNFQGVEGGILQMVNHGITIAALFLVAGWFESRAGTRKLADFGGLAARVPALATVFLIAALSALGLPGLNSFSGEFLAFLGVFQTNVLFSVLGTAVVIPAAWYMLRFFQGVTEGPLVASGPVAAALAGAPVTPPAVTTPVNRGASAPTPASAPPADSLSSGPPAPGGRGVRSPAPGGRGVRSPTHGGQGGRAGIRDLLPRELLVILPLLALIVYLGVQPGVLVTPMQQTVVRTLCSRFVGAAPEACFGAPPTR